MSVADRMGFGELLASGRMVDIKQVARGMGCGCICPACRRPLIARQGPKRTWHFSHAPGEFACKQGAETGLHRMAKQIIAQWNEVQLPALVIHADCETGSGRWHRAEETLAGERFAVWAGEIEVALGSLRTDVLLHDPYGRRLAVEVRVTHAVNKAKQSLVAHLDLAMVEYDLSPLPRDGIDEPTLAAELAVMAPQWIHHPQAGEVRRHLEEVLRQELEDEDQARRGEADPPGSTALVAIPQEEGTSSTLAETVDSCLGEGLGHHDPVEMVFDPALGLFQRGKPPKAPRRLGDFTLMGVEVRIRSHELLDAVAVWACDSRTELQQRVLRTLATDGRTAGVTCSTHALYLGYFLAWGSETSQWVCDLPGRVATLERADPVSAGSSRPERVTALLERLRLLRASSSTLEGADWRDADPATAEGCPGNPN